ncbi:MAG TPA: tetratricopeptide repeat protein [Planctomycetota bacterium]|nr:tetratricopeptide repeat protein [Planctomycetota bacterium]
MRFLRKLRNRTRFDLAAVAAAGLVLAALPAGCTPTSRGEPEAKLHMQKALDLGDKEQWDAAIQECELALRIDEFYAVCMAYLGHFCHMRGFDERAVQELQKALDSNDKVADAYEFLGEIYFDQHRDALAEENFQKAIDMGGGADDRFFHPSFDLGRLYERRGERDKALAAYGDSCHSNPRFTEAFVARGLLFLVNGHDKDANDDFLLALEHDPKNPLANMGLGKLAMKKEQWEEAISRHQKALEGVPADRAVAKAMRAQIEQSLQQVYAKCPPRIAKVLVIHARELLNAKKVEEAFAELDAAGRIDPRLMDVYVVRADVLIAQGKLAEAEKVIKAGLRVAPKNRDIRFMYGIWLRQSNRLKEGEAVFRELRREDPKKAGTHNWLALCYYGQRQYRRAEREWKEAIDLDPDNKLYQKNLEKIYETPVIRTANDLNNQGAQALKRGDLDQALDLFKQAIELDHEFAVAYANVALVLIEKGDLKLGRVKALEAIERDPDLGKAHNLLGLINGREGRNDEARKNFIEAAACDARDPEPHYNLGALYLGLKRDADALTEFDIAIGLDPSHVRTHHALGLYWVSKGVYDKAETEFKSAMRNGPKFVAARVALARLFLKEKRFQEAMKVLEEANGLDDADPEPWVGYGEAHEAMGEKAEAVNSYLEAASRFRAAGRYPEEVDICRKAAAVDAHSPKAHHDLGVALMDVGSWVDSLAELKQADTLDPNDLGHKFAMGICYIRRNNPRDKARAADCFREIIKAAPSDPRTAQAMEVLGDLYKCGASDNPLEKSEAQDILRAAMKLEKDPDRKGLIQAKIQEIEKCN